MCSSDLDCDQVAGGENIDCYEDPNEVLCYESELDSCGLCYGQGVLEGFCDCFNNITNCEIGRASCRERV